MTDETDANGGGPSPPAALAAGSTNTNTTAATNTNNSINSESLTPSTPAGYNEHNNTRNPLTTNGSNTIDLVNSNEDCVGDKDLDLDDDVDDEGDDEV